MDRILVPTEELEAYLPIGPLCDRGDLAELSPGGPAGVAAR